MKILNELAAETFEELNKLNGDDFSLFFSQFDRPPVDPLDDALACMDFLESVIDVQKHEIEELEAKVRYLSPEYT